MENFNRYINELLTIEIKTVDFPKYPKPLKYLSVNHYTKESGYSGLLNSLQEPAFTDLNNLTNFQIKEHLKHAEKIYTRLNKAEIEYYEMLTQYYAGKRIDKQYLDNESFFRFLQVPKYEGQVNDDFIHDLQKAITEKTGSIAGFIYQIKEKLGIQDDPPISTNNGLGYIKEELHPLLLIVEEKAKELKSEWQQGNKKIECAGFCENIFNRKWFVAGSTRIKSVNDFAKARYGIDIEIQLGKSKEADRITHRDRMNKYFK